MAEMMVNLTQNSTSESSGSSLEDYYAGEDTEFKVENKQPYRLDTSRM